MFDGPDGIGKTTQLELAADALKDKYEVYSTRIHGGTPIGEALRQISLSALNRQPLTDLYISLAIHAELAEQIKDNNSRGMITLVDRSPLSIIAYQAFGSGLDKEQAYSAVDNEMAGIFEGTKLVVFESTNKAYLDRMLARRTESATSGDYFESKPEDYFDRVTEGYQQAAKRYQAVEINADGTIEEVHAKTMDYIGSLLLKKGA